VFKKSVLLEIEGFNFNETYILITKNHALQ
jgi:hypothetical protein